MFIWGIVMPLEIVSAVIVMGLFVHSSVPQGWAGTPAWELLKFYCSSEFSFQVMSQRDKLEGAPNLELGNLILHKTSLFINYVLLASDFWISLSICKNLVSIKWSSPCDSPATLYSWTWIKLELSLPSLRHRVSVWNWSHKLMAPLQQDAFKMLRVTFCRYGHGSDKHLAHRAPCVCWLNLSLPLLLSPLPLIYGRGQGSPQKIGPLTAVPE